MGKNSTRHKNCLGLSLVIMLFSWAVQAQKAELKVLKSADPIICYQKDSPEPYHVDVPANFRVGLENRVGRVKTANIEVEYINFPADNQAKNAFQFAVEIWESQLSTNVPIRIRAQWGSLGSGVLGQAIWGSAYANFDGAQHQNVYYPVALAEKITGTNMNGNDPDISAQFNSSVNWYFGTDGKPPAGKMDLVMVVLHEICHGLGFTDTYSSSNGQGSVGMDDVPFVYDLYVVNSSKQSLFSGFASPSSAMNAQLTSNNLFYNSPLASASGTLPKIFAPSPYDAGSSIAHLDESLFSVPGDANNLMTPQIAQQEAIHQPGAITLGILNDMGWLTTKINHTALKDSERKDGSPYPVKATIISDNGFKANTVTLHYRTAANANYTSVQMTPTGIANEYQGLLPGSTVNIQYAYYITVEDDLSRTFRNPGMIYAQNQQPTQNFNVITIAPDTEGPEIEHTPIDFIFDTDTKIDIEASVVDNISVASVTLEYQIDGGVTQTLSMAKGTGDLYSSSIPVPASLTIGDLINYRILARDGSASSNQSRSPSSDFYTVFVTGDIPARNSYVNTFNTETFDFIGNSFAIQTPANFTDGAIHSEHPYKNGSGPNDESNYTYQLQVPIIISASNPFIKFDEIVLVEPGETGSEFGDTDFFDYVVVEGSKNNGVTWTPFEDGYDSRDNSAWLSRYNSNIQGDNSVATGIPSLFRERQINMLSSSNFAAGNTVKIRFRLFADQAANGWGWAIDNLAIQGDIVSVPDVPGESVEVYPNPARDYITVRVPTKNSAVEIFDVAGKRILSVEADEDEVHIDVHDFPAGLFHVRSVVGNRFVTRKFVKSN
ncbi:MAG TPA: T9SS type A sorting domain-containing protein [Chryseosolibacter sp.]